MRPAAALLLVTFACRPAAPRVGADLDALASCGPPTAPIASPARQVLQQLHGNEIDLLAFSDDGRYLATSATDGVTKVWDVEARAIVRALDPHDDFIPTLAWDDRGHIVVGDVPRDPDGKPRCDRGSGCAQARVFEIDPVRQIGGFEPSAYILLRRVPSAGPTQWVGFDSTGALARYDRNRRRIGALVLPDQDQDPERRVPLRSRTLRASPDGAALAAVWRNQVLIWSANPTADAPPTALTAIRRPFGVAPLPGGERVIVFGDAETNVFGHTIHVVDKTGAIPFAGLHEKELVQELAVSADGALLAAATTEGLVVWDVGTRTVRWRVAPPLVRPRPFAKPPRLYGSWFDPRDRGVGFEHVTFAPSGHLLAAATRKGVVLYDRVTGRPQGTLGVGLQLPTRVRFTADDELVVAALSRVTTWSLREARRLDDRSAVVPDVIDVARAGTTLYTLRSPNLIDHDRLNVDEASRDRACGERTALYIDGWDALRPPAELADYGRNGDGAIQIPAAWPPSGWSRRAYCIPPFGFFFAISDVDLVRGRVLYMHDDGPGRVPLYVRNLATGSVVEIDKPGFGDHAFSPDGRFVTTASTEPTFDTRPDVQLFDATTGAHVATRPGAGPVAFSSDGSILAAVDPSGPALVGYSHAGTTAPVFRVPIARPASAIAALRDGFVIGDDSSRLSAIRDGRIAWSVDGEATPLSIEVSPSGARMATISDDGAVRIWDVTDGTLIVTLLQFDDDEWIMLTPGGSYTGTAEAAERIGWVFERPLEYFRFEQFAAFHDRDAVVRRLAGDRAEVARAVQRPPRIQLVGTPVLARDRRTATVSVRVESPTRVDAVHVYADGRPASAIATCKRTTETTLQVPLAVGQNRLSIVAVDDHGYASNPTVVDVTSDGATERPDLWVVSVGVDRYPKLAAKWQLGAAVADARALASTFAALAGPKKRFGRARVTTLVDDQVTPASINQALEGLARMRPDDVAIVFLAGHGWKDQTTSDMVFVTGAAPDERDAGRAGIGWTTIGQQLARARGRVVVLLDACHAGHVSQEVVVPNGQLAAALHRQGRAGVFVFAASKGRELSYETAGSRALTRTTRKPFTVAGNHGIFTAALLAAVTDPATDRNNDGTIQIGELVDTVTTRVVDASGGLQTPWVARRELFADFGVAELR